MRSNLTIVLASCAVGGVAVMGASAASSGESAPRVQQDSRPITKIELVLKTGNRAGAGTDGDVFLGVAGREFFVDSQGDHDDFERNATRTYIFGAGANVQRASDNDPRSPAPLDLRELSRTPRYIRFEPGSDWDVERVDLTIIATDGSNVHSDRLDGQPHLWLGEKRGKVIHLP